jgi:GNAT superfamily N-acetyltransferase/predicted nucleic acid-binding protein
LADKYSKTLGFIPYGAFEGFALDGYVLGAVTQNDECVAYLAFQISKNRAKIIHLCVDENYRGKGISKLLLDALKKKTSDLQGIALSCRRDYALEEFWSSLGFVARCERPGKAKGGSILTEWWLGYGKPDLFSLLAEQSSESKLCVVIDANIFYDLADDGCSDEGSRESQALLADWISSDTEFFLTDEIHNEINRNPNEESRRKLNKSASNFLQLDYDVHEIDDIERRIRHLFPGQMKPSDRSDMRQIAKTISSNIDISFFLTRDRRLLDQVDDEVYKDFGLRIISPVEFILQQDQLRKDLAYQPARLAGTSIRKSKISVHEHNLIIDFFFSNELGESKASFRSKLNQALSRPDWFDSEIITSTSGDYLALIVVDRSTDGEFGVPILRVASSKIALTIAKHLMFNFVLQASNESRFTIKISEEYVTPVVLNALQEDNFFSKNNKWFKYCLPLSGSHYEVINQLSDFSMPYQISPESLKEIYTTISCCDLSKKSWVVNLEKTFYPLRIFDAEIPTFIIPIKGYWAKELFDEEISNEFLWGANAEIALNRECVYYRSKKATCKWDFPGRILWYVSQPAAKHSTVSVHAIRAVSFLDQVVVDKPKELYRKFKRLGVYTFDNLKEVVKGDLESELMAIRFSETQPLKKPVPLSRVQTILGKKTSLPAPLRINAHEFSMIYNDGMQS